MYSPDLYMSCAPVGASHGRAYSFFRLRHGLNCTYSCCLRPANPVFFVLHSSFSFFFNIMRLPMPADIPTGAPVPALTVSFRIIGLLYSCTVSIPTFFSVTLENHIFCLSLFLLLIFLSNKKAGCYNMLFPLTSNSINIRLLLLY